MINEDNVMMTMMMMMMMMMMMTMMMIINLNQYFCFLLASSVTNGLQLITAVRSGGDLQVRHAQHATPATGQLYTGLHQDEIFDGRL